METYVERIKHSAEHLAKDIFPKKALELDEIINVSLEFKSNTDMINFKPVK
jgi:hypothetical protein